MGGIAFTRILSAFLLSAAAVQAAGMPVRLDRSRSHVDVLVHATTGSFLARVLAFEADISASPDGSSVDSLQFQADFSAVKTGLASRDTDMNAWLQSARYPRVEFVLTSLDAGLRGTRQAHGRLRLHGVERAVTFPASITGGGGTLVADGRVAVDVRDFGLPVITKFIFLKVNPVVVVRFHLEGRMPPR